MDIVFDLASSDPKNVWQFAIVAGVMILVSLTIGHETRGRAWRDRIEALPAQLIGFGYALVSFVNSILSGLYIGLTLLAFVVPLGFSFIIAYVYSLNGLEAAFAGMKAPVEAFHGNAFIIFFAIIVASAAGSLGSPKSLVRTIASSAATFVIFFLSLAYAYLVYEFLLSDGRGERLLYASMHAGGWRALVSQVLLAPFYISVLNVALPFVLFVIGLIAQATAGVTGGLSLANVRTTFALFMRWAGSFIAGATVSFLVTILILMVSEPATREALFPTPQLLFWNAICDGLTLAVTMAALTLIYIQPSLIARLAIAIPVIAADLIAAAALACGALYLGLQGTANAVTLNETLYILAGLDKTGEHITLDAYFFVMHTTFIPTLLYIGFIVLAFVAALSASILFFVQQVAGAGFASRGVEFALTWIMGSATFAAAWQWLTSFNSASWRDFAATYLIGPVQQML